MQWMRLFGALSSPVSGRVVLGPNWFASVMGTGMIAIAGALLPLHFAWIDQISLFAWFASSVFLVILLIVVPLHWLKHPQVLRALLDDPVAIQFFGAPPMAIMTVGTASLLTGQHYLGTDAALLIAEFCWVTGTVLGYLVAIAVPFRLFTQLKVSHDGAFGGWLMPVVPPMVSATGGAVIAPYIVDPVLRESLILACYAMFGMSLTTSFMIITLIWSRLAHFGSSASVRVPTLWIVLWAGWPVGDCRWRTGYGCSQYLAGTVRNGLEITCPVIRRTGMGIYLAMDTDCDAADAACTSEQNGICTDLVVIHLPCGYLCDGNLPARAPQRLAGVQLAGNGDVRRSVGCMADCAGIHRLGHHQRAFADAETRYSAASRKKSAIRRSENRDNYCADTRQSQNKTHPVIQIADADRAAHFRHIGFRNEQALTALAHCAGFSLIRNTVFKNFIDHFFGIRGPRF
jgi:hypothetical protein